MGEPIKVLHIIGGGEFGGAEQHILSLLETTKQSNVDVEVLTFYEALFSKRLRELGFPVTVVLHV